MNIERAIELLGDSLSETERMLYPELSEAHKLAVEAFERVKITRVSPFNFDSRRLPSETEE